MDALTLAVAAGAGYVVVTHKATPEPDTPAQKITKTIAKVKGGLALSMTGYVGAKDPLFSTPAKGVQAAGSSSFPKEAQDELIKRAKKEIESMSGAARQAACERVKKQYPSNTTVQGIPCDASASAIFQALVVASATAAGTAVCGPVCGAVGAVVAAYIGPKVEEWAEDAWDAAKGYAEDAYDFATSPSDWF